MIYNPNEAGYLEDLYAGLADYHSYEPVSLAPKAPIERTETDSVQVEAMDRSSELLDIETMLFHIVENPLSESDTEFVAHYDQYRALIESGQSTLDEIVAAHEQSYGSLVPEHTELVSA